MKIKNLSNQINETTQNNVLQSKPIVNSRNINLNTNKKRISNEPHDFIENKNLKFENILKDKQSCTNNENFNFDDSFEFDEDFFDEIDKENINPNNNEIPHQNFYRFIVIKIVNCHDETVKQLIGKTTCKNNVSYDIQLNLEQLWSNCLISGDDIFNVINPIKTLENGRNKWIVNNNQGLIITNPDLLLNGTTITGSLFCQRKSILQHYFPDITGKTKKSMVLGSFIHLVFQKCSKEQHNLSIDKIKQIANDFLRKDTQIFSFFESEFTDNEIQKELEIYFPQILQWICQNICGTEIGCRTENKSIKDQSEENKKSIIDIEESTWSVKYGMKGKIDLTLQSNDKSIMPLELKTGKTSVSSDHMSQVLLYTLMMSDTREMDITKGILLYVKDGSENLIINNRHPSIMSLMMVRNELSNYLLKFLKFQLSTANESWLPDVLRNNRFCDRCEYLTLCSTFSRLTNESTNETMRALIKTNTDHLSEKDFQFLTKWINLILIEYFSEHSSEKIIKNIVTNKNSNNSIRNAYFESSKFTGNQFVLTFRFESIDKSVNKFTEGDPIIVSSDDGNKLAIATGFVCGPFASIDRLSILSDKPLPCSTALKLRIDPNIYMKIPISNLSVLANLMDRSDTSRALRRYIIHGDQPVDDSNNQFMRKSIYERIKSIVIDCNRDQKAAIMRTLLSTGFSLIKGYPGTGKTSCMVAMIRAFTTLGMRVLVSSYTHSAVSNILEKLIDKNIDFIYLNGSHKVTNQLMSDRTLASFMRRNDKIETISQLEEALDRINVIGVTCLSAHHPLLSRLRFDIVMIDEAGQITLPISLMPLLKMKPTGRFLLAGDLHQLPPLVRDSSARSQGLDQSLFSHLCGNLNHSNSISELTIQYRMNEEILRLCNQITYENRISCANDTVAKATFATGTKWHPEEMKSWKRQCFSSELRHSVVFVSHRNKQSNEIYSNVFEARLVTELANGFIDLGVSESEIGIIAPYNAQKDLLIEYRKNISIEINTIDQYQGKDKSIIIISLVRQQQSNNEASKQSDHESLDILKDNRRINVALTRSKHKLILIGNIDYLPEFYKPIAALRNVLRPDQIVCI